MNATIAVQMAGADFLKLRKKRSTVIWALVLAVAPLVIYFIFKGVQHSSSPKEHSPAGGLNGFEDAMPVLALFFGPLAAIMIGTDAGAGDLAAGVFRDLVVTGRSRVALFAARVPAAVGLCWLVMLVAYAVMVDRHLCACLRDADAGGCARNQRPAVHAVCNRHRVRGGRRLLFARRLASGCANGTDRLAADREPDPRKHRIARQLA